jgi:hypothetical protein
MFNLIRYRHYDHVASLCAFDLLELNGQDMRDRPLEERKAALETLLRRPHPGVEGSITTPATSAAKASYRSGSAPHTAAAGRQTGSRSRIRPHPRCDGSRKKIGIARDPSLSLVRLEHMLSEVLS